MNKYITKETKLLKIVQNKSFSVSILKTKQAISCTPAKEAISKAAGKEKEDTTNFTKFMKNWSKDGQVFQFLRCLRRKQLIIKMSNLLMKEDFILNDS